ncbi:MAG: shikimate kinase [Desulfamplus sp.]|nr:shikimate kinase [Desulfamplus sp.]
MKNIILTGFMGTGKSTAGKLTADALNYDFVDTDEAIMLKAGQTVAQIFESQGEDAFRAMEHDLAVELSERSSLVISTGGKMMLDTENVRLLGRNGWIFCLTASPEEIIERISRDRTIKRPLLDVADPPRRIRELLGSRKKGYEKFMQIDTTSKTPEMICEKILSLFKSGIR